MSSVDTVDTWSNSKISVDEFVFQIRARNDVTLHSCKTKDARDAWIYKVMKVMSGENPNSPSPKNIDKKKSKIIESSDDDTEEQSASDSQEDEVKEKPKKDSEKREDKRKKLKSKVSKKKLLKAKLNPPAAKQKKKKSKKSKKSRERSRSVTSQGSDQEVSRFEASEEDEDYVNERRSYYEDLSTEELVKLVASGLDEIYIKERQRLVEEWADKKKQLLLNLYRAEEYELKEAYKVQLEDVENASRELLTI